MKVFGTHFATLDLRQDSRVHQQIIDEIMSKKSGKNAENLSTDEKLKWILETETGLNHDAVSYTHLDVYKRQVEDIMVPKFIKKYLSTNLGYTVALTQEVELQPPIAFT